MEVKDGFIKIIDDTNELIQEALSHSENNGDWEHKIVLKKTTLQEVQEMILELNLKGSLRIRPNGLIEFRNPKLGSIYGRSKEEIQEKILKKLHELQSHVKRTPKRKKAQSPLLSVFYRDSYLPYKQSENIAANTISGYESNVRYIVSQDFDKPLLDYTSAEIEEFLYSIPETRKRQIMQGFLNNIFKRAVNKSIVKENPCSNIEKMKHTQEEGTALSFSEQETFFRTVFETEKISHTHKMYLLFVYLTGCRRDEARFITVNNVDQNQKVLHIFGTKTNGSDRYIPLFPLVEKVLQSVIPTDGRYFPIGNASADQAFRKCFETHVLHDLRHTFGTIQICCNKIDVKTVSLWMGHSQIHTTLDRYTHPEQLDLPNFLRGDLTEDEKVSIMQAKYKEILRLIYDYLG